MNPEKHPLQFKTPDLQKSDEVQESVERQERLNKRALDEARELAQETGQPIDPEIFHIKIPNNPTERINVYMDRMEKIFLNPDERVRKRNLKFLKPYIHDEFIIKPEQVPESYFQLQQQVAREQGIQADRIPDNLRKEMIDTLIKDQTQSLDNWIDYLSSEDATYPTWFKYFVFQNITKLSQFDKTLGKFKDRTDTTVAPYPDVYREPLAQICDMYEQVALDNKVLKTDPEIQQQFSKSFPKLYAELITKSLQSSIENKEEIKGEWIKYSQGNPQDGERLYKSLEGKGTGWCTAGRSTADTQIKQGDFYVYYTYNAQNEPVQPRVAIRMNGTNAIGEVRGILQHQALEPQFTDILEDKLSTFGPEAYKYKKKSEDMRRMTEIEKKTNAGEQLTKPELEFLYEINSTIEGFGYQKDPRIEEIRSKRNKTEDALIIFECTKEEIATSPEQVNENTKAYIGPWDSTIYQTLKNYPNITHLYESFPDKKIFTFELITDTSIQSPEQAKQKLESKGIRISDYGKDLLEKTQFSKEQYQYKLVQFTVEQLGFPQGATTDQIYTKAQELGLKLCPAEVGPQLRLVYEGKDWKLIAMKQVTDRGGRPDVFDLYSDDAWLFLGGSNANPDCRWHSDLRFVFLAS
jgi:hypothetical protein